MHDRSGGGSRDSEAQFRLQKLEEMVTSLMQTNKEALESRSDKTSLHNGTDAQSVNEPCFYSSSKISEFSSGERQNNNSSEKSYVSATHWTKILDDVSVSLFAPY